MPNAKANLGRVMEKSDNGTILQVAICDDEPLYRRKIEKILIDVFNKYNVHTKLFTYAAAKDWDPKRLSQCDIVLLDIDFKNYENNGISVSRELRKLNDKVVIIFVSNFIEHALEGYEVQAFRYILKDQIDISLSNCIYQALQQIKKSKDIMRIKTNGEIVHLEIGSVLYFEVSQHCVTAFLQREKDTRIDQIQFYASLSEIEEQLDQFGFLRVHNSYLVNMRHIVKYGCREVKLSNGTCLKVSEKKYAENKGKYLIWKGRELEKLYD